MRQTPLRSLGLALAIAAALHGNPAHAVVIRSGNGNTTANSFLNFDGSPATDPTVPGFAYVGSSPNGGASVVYLGGGWILTANHVSFSDASHSVVLGGISYSAETDTGGHVVPHVLTNPNSSTADLKLFHLTTTPSLASIIPLIISSSPTAGGRVIMTGNGQSLTSGQTYWDDSTAPWSEESAPGTPTVDDHSGFKVGSPQTIRWGDNKVLNTAVPDPTTGTTTFTTSFDDSTFTHTAPLASEAQATSGDSGGAVFFMVGTQWELAGIMINAPPSANQPDSTAVFGNKTYSADLSVYRTQILAIVPEPGSAVLALTAAATLALFWRRRNRWISRRKAPARPTAGEDFGEPRWWVFQQVFSGATGILPVSSAHTLALTPMAPSRPGAAAPLSSALAAGVASLAPVGSKKPARWPRVARVLGKKRLDCLHDFGDNQFRARSARVDPFRGGTAMAGPKRKHGFTLVELLVVITIIGMLVSLLLPAIQSAREAGRKNTCANNMRQSALAMANFEQNKRGFPGYANVMGTGVGTGLRVSWVVPILPYLERNDIYQNYQNWTSKGNTFPTGDTTPAVMAGYVTPLAVMVCPSNPTSGVNTNALSFVVNTGLAVTANDNFLSAYNYDTSKPNHGQNWAEDINTGVFFNQSQIDYKLPPKKVTMDFIGTNDGTSYTLMLSENLQATTWATEATDSSGATYPFQSDFSLRQNTGFVWYFTGTPGNAYPVISSVKGVCNYESLPINGLAKTISGTPILTFDSANTSSATGLAFARPSSNHPGGVNAFFCDGHMRFIAEDIQYHVYTQLMTPNQRGVVINPTTTIGTAGSAWAYTLNEADY